ncbi:MAG: T9SS type A sorting domain-containing protein, partial [bacterium]
MFRKHIIYAIIAVLVPTVLFSQVPSEEDINVSINKGLEFLTSQQNEDGSWGEFFMVEGDDGQLHEASERVAFTGFALTKLCERAYELDYNSPYEPDYIYSEHVVRGYDFLLGLADTYGDGKGIFIYETPDPEYRHHETYNVAVALMAIAASMTPDRIIVSPNPLIEGKPVIELVYEMVAYFVWSQNITLNLDGSFHPCYGGWNYEPGHEVPNDRSDNSITGFVVLALRYAEAIGAEIPPVLKDRLNVWIDYIQHDENGGSGYTEPDSPEDGQNLLRTGNLLFQLAFLGDDLGSPRVQFALEFIGSIWDVTDDINLGWWDNLLAMYCLKKGFESLSIDHIKVDGIERNWYEDFATFLVERQFEDGSWYDGLWGAELHNLVSTTWALLVLEKRSESSAIFFKFDKFFSHPHGFKLQQNYPNPFNPSTTIKYNLIESSNVILKIYNLGGQKVATLDNGFKIAGEHDINWQPKGLPSGIYFYRLQAGEYSE